MGYSDLGSTAWDIALAGDGSISLLQTIALTPGEHGGHASAITDGGGIAGNLTRINSNDNPVFVIRGGTLTLLRGATRLYTGQGMDLNDRQVVGYTQIATGNPTSAARWDSRNRYQDLDSAYLPSTWGYSQANGTNNSDVVVGYGGISFTGNPFLNDRAWLLR